MYLSLRVGTNNDETSKLWNNEALRTLRHNPKLRNKIIKSTQSTRVRSPAGIILAARTGGHWPTDAHDPIIEKIIRGLYFHHYREILGENVRIKVQWFKTFEDLEYLTRHMDSSLQTLWTELPGAGHLGVKNFRYRHAVAIKNPLHSIWMFDFYGAHFAGGSTSPLMQTEGISDGIGSKRT